MLALVSPGIALHPMTQLSLDHRFCCMKAAHPHTQLPPCIDPDDPHPGPDGSAGDRLQPEQSVNAQGRSRGGPGRLWSPPFCPQGPPDSSNPALHPLPPSLPPATCQAATLERLRTIASRAAALTGGQEINLSSSAQLAKVLYEDLGLPAQASMGEMCFEG